MKSRKVKTVRQGQIKNFDELTPKKLNVVKGGSQGVSTFDLVL